MVAEFPRHTDIVDGHAGKHVGESEDPDNPGKRKALKIEHFDTGWARWSGTSFSAPFVTAQLAKRLKKNPNNLQGRDLQIKDALDHVVRNPELDWLPNYGRLLSYDLA